MLDPKLLRADLDAVAAQLGRRGFVLDTARIAELEAEVASLKQRLDER